MREEKRRNPGIVLVLALGLGAAFQVESEGDQTTLGVDQLISMSPGELESLYSQSSAVVQPQGKVRGTPLIASGTDRGGWISKGGRLVWQGKVFKPERGRAVNRFFGLRSVPAAVYVGRSLRDGRPALILDYSETSWVYRPYRDEIRMVFPGVYLGLMYDQRTCPPKVVRIFALEDSR